MKQLLGAALYRLSTGLGVTISRRDQVPGDIDETTAATFEAVRPYTVTSAARVNALCQAVRHVVGNGIRGAVVECGVWRGGSMMAAARTLSQVDATDRDLYLFDTFEGAVAPGDLDRWLDGSPALPLFERARRSRVDTGWRAAPIEVVRSAMARTGYPTERVRLVQGLVEDTVPQQAPPVVSILRLDTDWYQSTRHELEHLYPRLSPGGVIIIDDYGHWQGARRAVDEYFATLAPRPLLHRIDDSGRAAVVPD